MWDFSYAILSVIIWVKKEENLESIHPLEPGLPKYPVFFLPSEFSYIWSIFNIKGL